MPFCSSPELMAMRWATLSATLEEREDKDLITQLKNRLLPRLINGSKKKNNMQWMKKYLVVCQNGRACFRRRRELKREELG